VTSTLAGHFRTLARYNTLANRRLYDACAGLGDADRKQPRPAFFKSIHGTLNHILIGDRIWLTRFSGREVPSTALDAILYEDFAELRTVREAEDARIETFAASLTDLFLQCTVRYVNHQGKLFEDPMPMLVAHFFNHQTHHRGQVHDLLSQTAVPPPSLDLHRVLKPTPASKLG
jgi:uncharacterized damage-inducible protein DinB